MRDLQFKEQWRPFSTEQKKTIACGLCNASVSKNKIKHNQKHRIKKKKTQMDLFQEQL